MYHTHTQCIHTHTHTHTHNTHTHTTHTHTQHTTHTHTHTHTHTQNTHTHTTHTTHNTHTHTHTHTKHLHTYICNLQDDNDNAKNEMSGSSSIFRLNQKNSFYTALTTQISLLTKQLTLTPNAMRPSLFLCATIMNSNPIKLIGSAINIRTRCI